MIHDEAVILSKDATIDDLMGVAAFHRTCGNLFHAFVYNQTEGIKFLDQSGVYMEPMRVLVTGASRGIGFEIAKMCIEKGYSVLAVARDEVRLSRAALSIDGLLTFKVDLTVDAEVEALVRHIADEWGGLDVLINNAGVMPQGERHILTCSEEDFDYTMKVNFTAPYRLTKALLPFLQTSASPRIINISSTMGVIGTSLSGVYGLSKAMLNSLTVALSNELAGSVVVNSVSPGWVKTDMAPDGPGDPTDSARTVLHVMHLDDSITGGFFGSKGRLKFVED